MTTYMHCRPCSGANLSTCLYSFFSVRPNFTTTSNYQMSTSSFNHHHHHDQTSSPAPSIPKRRRRLEDPITTYASNYYATLPLQTSQSSSQSSSLLSPPPRQSCQKFNRNGIYCDLFNLLESSSHTPSSSSEVNQKRRYNTNKDSARRNYRLKDFGHVHTKKTNNTNDRKRSHQQSPYYKEKGHEKDTLLTVERYDRSIEKAKLNDIHQRRSTNKGFFRRLIRNYLCMPSMITNSEYSS